MSVGQDGIYTPTPMGSNDYLDQILAQQQYQTTPPVYYGGSRSSMYGSGGYGGATLTTRNRDVTRSSEQHNANFYDYWRQDAAWRSRMVNYGLSFGIKSNDTQALTKLWNAAGDESARLYASGKKMTPEQILRFWSGSDGKTPGGGSGGGPTVSTQSSTSSSVSYDISDARTAKALTNAVLTAALGREATADELEKYKKALNSYEKGNPSRSTQSSYSKNVSSPGSSHTTSASSTVSHAGASAQGREQTIKDEVMQTDEAQAWTTSNLFQAAMDRLASRIG